MLFLDEITAKSTEKVKAREILATTRSKMASCTISGYQILYSVNFSRESSINENRDVAMYNNEIPCRQLTCIETSCYADNHGCISNILLC